MLMLVNESTPCFGSIVVAANNKATVKTLLGNMDGRGREGWFNNIKGGGRYVKVSLALLLIHRSSVMGDDGDGDGDG
jgi:hypothetical protein